ncbi:hypothetical protein ACFXG7_36980 [Nocardia tengchongensis]|uniref:hypothetical protein n=2 Tax=Nocardia tengchongensis TaxID=2055889 RepID=UPI0036A017F7
MNCWIVEGSAVDTQDVTHLIVDLHNTGEWTLRCTGRPAKPETALAGRARCLRCSLRAADAFRLGDQPLHVVQEWMRVDHTALPRPVSIQRHAPERRTHPATPAESASRDLTLDLTDPDMQYVITDALARWAAHQRRKARAEPDTTLTATRNRWADLADTVRVRADGVGSD